MSEWKPGTVAEVTFKGQRVRAVRINHGWQMTEPVDGYITWSSSLITDVRPLVVLELLDPGDAPELIALFRKKAKFPDARLHKYADQIEAQVKPARIPEPGKYAIVHAWTGSAGLQEWVSEGKHWVSLDSGERRPWVELVDPKVVREGVA